MDCRTEVEFLGVDSSSRRTDGYRGSRRLYSIEYRWVVDKWGSDLSGSKPRVCRETKPGTPDTTRKVEMGLGSCRTMVLDLVRYESRIMTKSQSCLSLSGLSSFGVPNRVHCTLFWREKGLSKLGLSEFRLQDGVYLRPLRVVVVSVT